MTGAPLDGGRPGAPGADVPGAPRPGRGRRILRRLAQALALGAILSVPWWGRAALRRLDFFHVRAVEVTGIRYLEAAEVVRRLDVDTLQSIWDELAPLEQRVAAHPQVRTVRVSRRLPGTLVVRVDEHLPVAFVAGAGGLRVLDAAGRTLPIDPSRRRVDLPIVSHPDSAILRLLAELREREPAMYRRVSEVRRVGRDELLLRLFSTTVRARPTVTAARLAEIALVEADLARRGREPTELDLRFSDQVIARFP